MLFNLDGGIGEISGYFFIFKFLASVCLTLSKNIGICFSKNILQEIWGSCEFKMG